MDWLLRCSLPDVRRKLSPIFILADVCDLPPCIAAGSVDAGLKVVKWCQTSVSARKYVPPFVQREHTEYFVEVDPLYFEDIQKPGQAATRETPSSQIEKDLAPWVYSTYICGWKRLNHHVPVRVALVHVLLERPR